MESTECGAAEHFHFARESGGSDLQDHEAGVQPRFAHQKCGELAGLRVGHLLDAALGDSAERGEGDGELIGGHGQRLAVKISAADHFV